MQSRRSEAAALHSIDRDYHIRSFEHLNHPVEDALIVLRSRLRVLFKYSLRFV